MRCKPKNRASCCQIRTRMMAEAAAVAAWVELTVSKMSRVGWGGMVARPCQCGLVNVCSWGAAPRALTFEWRRGGQKPPSNIVAVEKKSGRFVGAKPPQRNPVLGPLGRGLDYSSFFQHHDFGGTYVQDLGTISVGGYQRDTRQGVSMYPFGLFFAFR